MFREATNLTKVTTSKCQGGIPAPGGAGTARYGGSCRLSWGSGRWYLPTRERGLIPVTRGGQSAQQGGREDLEGRCH